MNPEIAWRQKANYNFSLPSDFAIRIYSITVYLNIVERVLTFRRECYLTYGRLNGLGSMTELVQLVLSMLRVINIQVAFMFKTITI